MDKLIKRTILIVDDVELNREILADCLSDEYDILMACDGAQALDTLGIWGSKISLVLLDILMPVIDGYGLLEKMRQNHDLVKIPVIVTTSQDTVSDEIKCLQHGAADFVRKPFNEEVLRNRVDSLIRLREASETLEKVERDRLTGLYNKEFFFFNANRILESKTAGEMDMVSFDIESLKLINEFYTVQNGDACLKVLAEHLDAAIDDKVLLGRVSMDEFAMLMPHIDMDTHIGYMKNVVDKAEAAMPVPNVHVKVGIYQSVPTSMQAELAYERAQLALDAIKGRYKKRYSLFDREASERRLRERRLCDLAARAIEEGEFAVYYQPKHNVSDGSIAGSEALARWISPELGFVNPGEFIPLFEKNGFITDLDLYVCGQVCKDLREWLDSGREVRPVSLNLSRIDFSLPELPDQLVKMVDDYSIPHELVHFEVTESAYIVHADQMETVLEKLSKQGFLIEIDDFGAGYSQLNVLDNLTCDIIKLDMQLVARVTTEKTAVITSVIELAKKLGNKIVAEGVETREQVDKLREFGCDYAQGFYFSKPLSKSDFENYISEV